MVSKRGILCASGGLDSTVLAYELASKGRLEALFFVNYGQASANAQHAVLNEVSAALCVPLHEEIVNLPPYMRGTGVIMGEKARVQEPEGGEVALMKLDHEAWKKWNKTTFDFMEGRNTIFLTMACAYAVSLGLHYVYTGFQQEEYQWQAMLRSRQFYVKHMDTTPGFVDEYNNVAFHSFSEDVKVVSPFLDRQMDKRSILKLGKRLNAPVESTYSCEFYPPCGECIACARRNNAVA